MWRVPRAFHRHAWLAHWGSARGLSSSAETEPSAQTAERSSLSPREREVAGLIAQGLSNRAIADRLGLSERTIEAHVEHILGKLGFRSRARVAAWVTQGETRTRSV
jgi:DNA-binding NarL/FixJ family response regulator